MNRKMLTALAAAAAVAGGAAVFADSPAEATTVWDGVYTEEHTLRGKRAAI